MEDSIACLLKRRILHPFVLRASNCPRKRDRNMKDVGRGREEMSHFVGVA